MDYSFTDADVEPRAASSSGETQAAGQPGRTSWPIGAIVLIQSILFLGHWLIYHTVNAFWSLGPSVSQRLAAILFILSVSFILVSLLTFRFSNGLVGFLYKLTAIWLGILNFVVWASCLCWLVLLGVHLAAPNAEAAARPWIAVVLFGAALGTAAWGIGNALVIRERHVRLTLPGLPASWRGRRALVLSDLHLGNVNGTSFAGRIAKTVQRLNPEIVFIAGDLYDGTRVDPAKLASPLFELSPPLGIYFAGGNHEEFGDAAGYSAALRRGGIHVLHNEMTEVDGVRIIGVPYADTTYPLRYRAFLDSLGLDRRAPSILLNHIPSRLPIAEQAGVSLQLSGHTHGGQIVPFTWFTRRAFGPFTYGLQKFGQLQVLISSGAGTWGPPMRVGSAPEVVLITFE